VTRASKSIGRIDMPGTHSPEINKVIEEETSCNIAPWSPRPLILLIRAIPWTVNSSDSVNSNDSTNSNDSANWSDSIGSAASSGTA
jgi:hypothetical protein